PILIYLMLAYPDGRLTRASDRRLYVASALLIAVLYVGSAPFVESYPVSTPWATCSTDCPPNAFLVLNAEPAVIANLVVPFRELVSVALLAGVTVSLVRRRRAAPPLRRRTIGPVLAMNAVSTSILAAYLIVRRAAPDADVVGPLGTLWSLTVSAIAGAFLIGLVRGRMLVAEVLTRLSLALSRFEPRELRSTLAVALDDPDVDVIEPADIRRRRLEAAADGRVVTPVEDDAGPV